MARLPDVPLFDMAAETASIRPAIDAAIARVLDSGVLVGGIEVTAFETELAHALGVEHAIGVSSGSDALHSIAMALELGPGCEFVTSPFTFVATVGSLVRLGAQAVFADVDDATLTLDPSLALAACSPRTRAIVPVHLYGQLANLPTTSLPIIEDAAQSIGAGPVRGIAAALSMFPTKNLGALGDAGAVLTNDGELAARVRTLRAHGSRVKYQPELIGGNFRLDALQAAVLRAKLPHLGRWNEARRAHAADYRRRFAAARLPAELRLPHHDGAHVYHQFVIRTPQRDALRAHLAANGVGTEIYYPMPLHLAPWLVARGYRRGSFPIAERAAAETLALPIHPALSAEARETVVGHIEDFFAR